MSKRDTSVCKCSSDKPAALISNMTKTLCKSHQNDCCFLEGWVWLIFLNAYWCNLNICMLLQNAERVQIGVMKPFHYGDEQCWINRNNGARCFTEPAVAFWHRALLCLQLCWTARARGWLLQRRDNRDSKHQEPTWKQTENRFSLQILYSSTLDLNNNSLAEFALETIMIVWFITQAPGRMGSHNFEKDKKKEQAVMPYSRSHLCTKNSPSGEANVLATNKVEQFLLI